MTYYGELFTVFDREREAPQRDTLLIVDNRSGYAWNVVGDRAIFISALFFNTEDEGFLDPEFVDTVCRTAVDFESSSPRSRAVAA